MAREESGSITSSIQKLRELAPKLNQVADDAARVMQHVENLLANLSLGVGGEATFFERQVRRNVYEFRDLAYKRIGGKYRLAVVDYRLTDHGDPVTGRDEVYEVVDEKPWAECPREVKIESFPSLPTLLEDLVKKALAAVSNIEKAQAAATALLTEVEASPKS